MQIFRSAFVVGNQRSGSAFRSTQWISLAAWKRSLIDRFCLLCASGFTTHRVPTRLIWKMTRKMVLMNTFYFPKLDFCLLTYFFLVFKARIPFFLISTVKQSVPAGSGVINALIDWCHVTERVIGWQLRDLADGVHGGLQTGWTQTAFIVLYFPSLLGVFVTPSGSQLYLCFGAQHSLWYSDSTYLTT